MARLFPSTLLLALLVASRAAAWTREGCYDEIVGESGHFGTVGEMKPKQEVDHTQDWKDFGAITKLNLFYSWNYGCLQGIKATYGYKAGNARIIGHEKNLYTQHLKLADFEHVNKFDVVQQPNKCIEFIKLYTNKGQTLAFGNAKSTSPKETVIAPEGTFLVALKGEHDLDNGVQAGLQNLKFVWAKEVCPTAAPVPKPEAPTDEGSMSPPGTGDESAPAPVAEPPSTPAPTTPAPMNPTVCPAMPAQCDEKAAEGAIGFCPVVSPFTAPKCNGGCCISTGKCKMPLCKFNGLGADVIALDFICYGKNNGPFAGMNKCRNLACKLAVPGCQSGLLGGNCVGTVEAVNDEVDDDAKQYIGMPCLEIINTPGPLHMPLNKPGLPVPNGEYMGGLWSVCDCTANPSPVLPAIPFFDIKKHLLARKYDFFRNLIDGVTAAVTPDNNNTCIGPLCALLPQLPVMNATLPDLQIPMALLANITALLKPKPLDLPALGGLIPQIQLPQIEPKSFQLTLPDLPTFEEVVGYFVNITNTLKPAIEAALPVAQPLAIHEVVQIVSSLLPEIRFQLPQLDITNMPKLQLPDLTSLVSALLPKIPEFPQLKVNLPNINLPTINMPTINMPDINMPDINMPKFGGNFTIGLPKLG